jgi:BTB/POZ domain
MDSDSDSPTYEFVIRNVGGSYSPNTPLLGPVVHPTTGSIVNNKPTFKRVQELYFPDGNIILEAGTTHFRVSRGILAARSPVFKEVLSLPQPKEGGVDGKVDGCDVVHLFGDDPQEVTYFLRAIYDSRCVMFH